jgi:hypothetical protein
MDTVTISRRRPRRCAGSCYGRVLGVTPRDEEYLPQNPSIEDYTEQGCAIRARQILEHLEHWNPYSYAVLDDMEVPVNRLVRTDGNRGLHPEHVLQVAVWLQKPLS